MAHFDQSDTEWSIAALLRPDKPRGVPRVEERRMANDFFCILRVLYPAKLLTN